jgi:hypothetical protein
MSDTNYIDENYIEEDYEEDETYIYCARCGCTIGEEVSMGEEIAPGEIWCDNCLGRNAKKDDEVVEK